MLGRIPCSTGCDGYYGHTGVLELESMEDESLKVTHTVICSRLDELVSHVGQDS